MILKKVIYYLILSTPLFVPLNSSKAETVEKMEGAFRDTVIIGALDKVTARTSTIKIKVGETVKIGTLKVRAIRAWRSNPEEMPESKVFFEITEKKDIDKNEVQEVFRGWMFASNPSLSALEHPVYDVWVVQVQGPEDNSDLPASQLVDEETSQRIDDLIDKLIDQSANDIDLTPEALDIIEKKASQMTAQAESLEQPTPEGTIILSHGHSKNALGAEIKNIEDKLSLSEISFEDSLILKGLFEEMKNSPIGLKLIEHKGLNAEMTQQAVLYDHLIKPVGHYPDGTPLADFDRKFYETFPVVKATQERGEIFKKLIQQALPKKGVVGSCPCGLMDDLLRLNYDDAGGVSLVGIDLDQQALDQAKENAEKLLVLIPHYLEKRDAWDLESSERFDILTSNGLNIYVNDEEKVKSLYRSFYDSLKPNGVLVISALTPPPALDPKCEWDFSKIDPEALLMQKRILSDILNIKWLNFRRSDVTVAQLKEAGFKSVDIHWDQAKIFPTFFCKK
ncbi:MAG TPA: hypothetical protein DD412_04300 [Holosporales bacterium]|nr:hypothetical protein [Holosporales bacterium]